MKKHEEFTINLLTKNTLLIMKKRDLTSSQKKSIKKILNNINLETKKFESKITQFNEIALITKMSS